MHSRSEKRMISIILSTLFNSSIVYDPLKCCLDLWPMDFEWIGIWGKPHWLLRLILLVKPWTSRYLSLAFPSIKYPKFPSPQPLYWSRNVFELLVIMDRHGAFKLRWGWKLSGWLPRRGGRSGTSMIEGSSWRPTLPLSHHTVARIFWI